MTKLGKESQDIPIKLQLFVALLVMIMFSQLIAYIAYTLDPGALVIYQPHFWLRGLYGLLASIATATFIFLISPKLLDKFFRSILNPIKYILMIVTIGLLMFLLTPVAPSIYGAKRWLFGFQISDIAKLIVLIFISFVIEEIWADWYKQKHNPELVPVSEKIFSVITLGIFVGSLFLSNVLGLALAFTTLLIYVVTVVYVETRITGKNFFIMAILFGLTYVLILLEPDISTSSLFALWFLFMLMLWYGRRGRHIASVVLVGIFISAYHLRSVPLEGTIPHQFAHAISRLLVWKDPFIDPNGISYHVVKNFLAVFKGGLWGSYPANMNYIPPVPWSDAILPFTAVTLGMVFELLLVGLWLSWGMFFLISGLRMKSYKGLFVSGFALWFLLQMVFNMLSTYDVFPPTGISVPFLSWGRTGLIIFTIMNSIAAVFVAEDWKHNMKDKEGAVQ
ncbi:hypothetical protein GM182_03715 [bacterium 3DAC]|nr:FtsW/RodA/SpoVE family cell cycle protein [Dictyoglomota bacterium]UZN23012.1 hypothetical protein GM182_03715 [bacterium 3DAC]